MRRSLSQPLPLQPIVLAILAALGTIPMPGIAQSQTEQRLPPVEVVGRTQSGDYHADEASGTKTELPLRELPQSVRVITRQTIDDLGAVRFDDVLDYVGGVSRQNNFGGLWDNIAIRGLPGDINVGMFMLQNGFAGNRGFNAPRDLANIERIEFLKGPAAALYGASEPGGTVNLVTKKPLFRAAHAIEGYVGSYDFYRVALDSTAPLTESVAYRLNVAVEDRGSFRDYIDTFRTLVAPALRWDIGPSTRLDYSGEWLRQKTPLDRGVVAVNNQLGAVPRERFLGEPADGDVEIDNQTHQLILEHAFDPALRGRLGVSYRTGTLEGFSTEANTLLANGRTLTRQRRFRDYESDDLGVQGELVGKFNLVSVPNELLVGVEAYRFELDQLLLRINPSAAAPYAIDIFNPVYGQRQPTPLPNTDTHEEQRNVALYVQDVVTLAPQWRLLGGVRYDRFDQTLDNRRTNVRTEQEPSRTSPRVGLSYLPSEQWTVYFSGGRSFRPNVGVDAAGAAFDPENGRALEVGAKYEGVGGRIGATAAAFDIRKRNVLTSNPANPSFPIAAGQIRSRGIEFDLAGQVTSNLRLNAAFTYNDVTIDRDNQLEVGGRLLNVPRVNGSVLAVYDFGLRGGQRIGFGGGATHVGDRLGQARTQAEANAGVPAFELPSYTTAKLVAYWRATANLRVSLDVDNLFDKTYYTSSFSRVWITPGTARTVTVGLQARL